MEKDTFLSTLLIVGAIISVLFYGEPDIHSLVCDILKNLNDALFHFADVMEHTYRF